MPCIGLVPDLVSMLLTLSSAAFSVRGLGRGEAMQYLQFWPPRWGRGFLRPWGCRKSFQVKWQGDKSNETINVYFESDLPPQPPLSEESCKLEKVVFSTFIFQELQSDQHFPNDISRLFHSVWQMIFLGQTDDETKRACMPCKTWKNCPSSRSLSVNELSRLLNFQSLFKT